MNKKFSIETTTRVYNDDDGSYVSIGPDTDGLDLCRIAYSDDGKTVAKEITMPWAQAMLIAGMIKERADEVIEALAKKAAR
jgi:hypothetical protein